MSDDVLDALADRDAPEPEPARHWDGPMPLSVRAGIAWWVVVPAGLAMLMIVAVDWLVH